MQKIIAYCTLICIFVSLGIPSSYAAYLVTGKNYYTDSSISKGFLDEVIAENTVNSPEAGGNTRWTKFQNAIHKNIVKYTPGMTFNQYFLENNISPEDAFKTHQLPINSNDQEVILPSGGLLTADTDLK